MGKTCAWCGTVLRAISGTAIPSSQALCQGCFDELQGALSSSGLTGTTTKPGSQTTR